MKYKLELSNGSSARGAQMGRRDQLPYTPLSAVKMHLTKLKWVDGDYDQFGAYWGWSPGNSIYCAESVDSHPWKSNWDGSMQEPRTVLIFVRASSRAAAKDQVRDRLPKTKVTFFN